jgi:uncharacterized protein
MVYPGGVGSLAPKPTGIDSRSASPPLVSVSLPGRIPGYDVARALAVTGMVIVNFHSIFLIGRSHHPRWFVELAFLLYGRAAAIFVMLAGVGITLMSHKALLSHDPLKLRLVRQGLLKRSLVLFLMGLFFLHWWRADILHFYGAYLSTGAFLLSISGRRLWTLIGFFLVPAAAFFCLSGADPSLTGSILPSNPITRMIDDLLISGHYPMFPWFAFLLTGMWLGRPEIISNKRLMRRILVAAVLVLAGTLALEKTAHIIFAGSEKTDESLQALLLMSEVFPISPLFAVSAMASSLTIIILAMSLCSRPLFSRPAGRLVAAGKMSLTIYIGHVFVGLLVQQLVQTRLDSGAYQAFSVLFTLAFCLAMFVGANLWFRYSNRGPLEWLLRRASHSL